LPIITFFPSPLKEQSRNELDFTISVHLDSLCYTELNMADVTNLADRIKTQLPAELVEFLVEAGKTAQGRQARLYLVGGVVRDLLLGRSNLDLDLVVEGDAINLAQALARWKRGKVTPHPRFGTARLQWANRSVDLATARAETYASPGTLPTVRLGASISDDLSRRDFTINAMAAELNPARFGGLLDPHQGRDDLERRCLRVLHEKSFIDDATRIWRALRYEQRLEFAIEPSTLKLLKRDISRLDTISGDRIRHELELILKEEQPERALQRADELGVLVRLHPQLKGDDWLGVNFLRARELSLPGLPPLPLYLSLLAYRLTGSEIEQLISYLRLPKLSARALLDTVAIKGIMRELSVPGLAPSRVYARLHGYTTIALTANALATEATAAAEHIQLYLDALRYVNPTLTGEDLKKLGVPEGPKIKEILELLREARLDGKVSTRKEEEEMARTKFHL
jgi:tRNA nucleotidyltransferase (CCA-adding enzyme)